MRILVVDAANVVGARPNGWWKDRPGAARRLHEALLVADLDFDEVVVVLEGAAKAGVAAGRDGDVVVVHAAGEGDRTILAEVTAAAERGQVTLVSADRVLQANAAGRGASAHSPMWLWEALD